MTRSRKGFMPIRLPILIAVVLTILGGSLSPAHAQSDGPADPPAAALGPDGGWLQYASPAEAGFSEAALEATLGFADSVGSAAVLAVHRGRVLVAWGDVTREYRIHSVRKSLYSAMYGVALEKGLIDLDETLAGLGIDDVDPLTEREKSARVEDLIAARSGVYLPAAYAPSDQDEERPERGSHPPGTHFFYNNWDFNVSGVLLERAAGKDLYRAFEQWIADPIGMEDYEPSDGFEALEPSSSRWPAHTFRMSTRDLARFGQLYLQDGRWQGRSVVPASWVERSTRPASVFEDGAGYGYMWWTYPAEWLPQERYPHLHPYEVVQARGTGGQAIFVIRDADLVVVHRGDTDRERHVRGPHVWQIVERILAAGGGSASEGADLTPLDPVPLPNALPPLDRPEIVEADPDKIRGLVGDYTFGPGVEGRIFLHDGRPYIFVPGEGEAELFATADGAYTIQVVSGVTIHPVRSEEGEVTAIVLRLGEREMRAEKRAVSSVR